MIENTGMTPLEGEAPASRVGRERNKGTSIRCRRSASRYSFAPRRRLLKAKRRKLPALSQKRSQLSGERQAMVV